MSEVSVQIKHQAIGYNKTEVKMLLKKMEALLQERAMTIDAMQQQITGLEAKLEQATTPEAVEAAEKIELYDKLMKKMDGDFRNLLAPAQAKAKAIEEKALADYELRIDQAREAADGIYAMAADRIAEVVDANMDRMYELLDDYIYSKSLPGRFQAFCETCNMASMKVASGIVAAAKLPGKAIQSVTEKVKGKLAEYQEAEEDTYFDEEYEL
jgi:hypothetical protein